MAFRLLFVPSRYAFWMSFAKDLRLRELTAEQFSEPLNSVDQDERDLAGHRNANVFQALFDSGHEIIAEHPFTTGQHSDTVP